MTHGFIPLQCLHIVIVAIPKGKNVDLNNLSNYKPIAVETVIFKLFEHFILLKIFFYLFY